MSQLPDKCTECNRNFRSNSTRIKCYTCNSHYHFKCSKLSRCDYNYFRTHENCWMCTRCCSEIFPFHQLSAKELVEMSFNSNTLCLCSKNIDMLKLDNLPRFDIVTSFSRIPSLNEVDIDQQLPNQVNFKYYSTHEFHVNTEFQNHFTNKSFSALHSDIRSLSLNHNKLFQFLNELQHPFSVVGLSETRIKLNNDCLLYI